MTNFGSAGWFSVTDFDVTSAPIASGSAETVTSGVVPFLIVMEAPTILMSGVVPAHFGRVAGNVRYALTSVSLPRTSRAYGSPWPTVALASVGVMTQCEACALLRVAEPATNAAHARTSKSLPSEPMPRTPIPPKLAYTAGTSVQLCATSYKGDAADGERPRHPGTPGSRP